MAHARYVKWLLRVTVPADDHKLTRVMPMNAPDDELELLQTHVPRLNKDMKVVSHEAFDDPAKFEAAAAAAVAEAKAQQGYKAFGPYDIQLTQEQVDKIKADKAAAVAKLAPVKPSLAKTNV